MTGEITLLVRPTAQRGRGAHAARPAASAFRAAGLSVTTVTGTDPADTLRRARAAVAAGTRALIAVGGDGTVSLALQAVAGTATPLGVVAAGTGNDFARTLGLPVRDPAAFRPVPYRLTLDDGAEREIEAALVAVGNGSSYGGGMRVCAGARTDDGLLDVTVVGRCSRTTLLTVFPRVYRGTHLGRVVRISVASRCPARTPAALSSVGDARRRLPPPPCRRTHRTPLLHPRRSERQAQGHPAVTVHRAARVALAAPGLTGWADGERLGPLPLTAVCVPGAVRVLGARSMLEAHSKDG
ncbi:diacylglycerol kinase family protein [Streptomyces liangshanensis]|uniref:diacylglycerol kinase family protein n=1 Tax=Streptomyces liangshanensis TaxID=2717324 RepID=UPI0036D8DAF7